MGGRQGKRTVQRQRRDCVMDSRQHEAQLAIGDEISKYSTCSTALYKERWCSVHMRLIRTTSRPRRIKWTNNSYSNSTYRRLLQSAFYPLAYIYRIFSETYSTAVHVQYVQSSVFLYTERQWQTRLVVCLAPPIAPIASAARCMPSIANT